MSSRRVLPQLFRATRHFRLPGGNVIHPIIPFLAKPIVRVRQSQILPTATRLAHTIPRPNPRPLATENAESSSSSTQSKASSDSTPSAPATPDAAAEKPLRASQQPHYELTFTCVPCSTRSRHKISKAGYHHGSVLITCPGCRNRHVISDHLGIFGDRAKGITVEDLARERGILVKKGALGEDGDLEFWEDGSVTARNEGMEGVVEGKSAEDGVDPNAAPGASFKKD